MTNQELARKIIDLVGGEKNVKSLTHCITRLRFVLNDDSKADKKELEKLKEVMGVQSQGGQYQVIVGGIVAKVYREISKILPRLDKEGGVEDQTEQKGSIFSKIIDTLSGILVPSLAPIIGGGMLKGLLFLLTSTKMVSDTSDTIMIMNIAADCMFYFFPFLLAVSAAKKFRTNEYMALALSGALMYPTLVEAATAGVESFMFLGAIPIPAVNYSSSILPIILSVWLLKYVYGFFEEHIPDMVNIIFTPLITIIIMVPVMLFALAPLGYYAGEYLAQFIEMLINFSPLIAGFVVGSTRPLLVLTGMHHALRPITNQQIATFGYSTMGAMNFMSTMAQATAAVAIYAITKDKKMKQVSLSATISGYLGITEPALYGVLIKYKAALVGSFLGGGIGGAIGAVLGARSLAPAMPSVLSIPVFLGDTAIGFFIGFAITVVSTFIITIFLSKSFLKLEENTDENQDVEAFASTPIEKPSGKVFDVYSPISGTILPMSKVNDQTFASEVMGKGIAIKPNENHIISPIDGKIMTIFKTKHAIGIVSNDGVEVLLHIGIDTVKLEGQYFELQCKVGQIIKKGEPIVTFDRKKIEELGYDTTVIVIVINTNAYLSVIPEFDDGIIIKEEKILAIVE